MSAFFISTSEAEDETSDVAIAVAAGSGRELLLTVFIPSSESRNFWLHFLILDFSNQFIDRHIGNWQLTFC